MLTWALRTVLLWGLLAYAGYWGWENRATLMASLQPGSEAAPSPQAVAGKRAVANSLTYRAGANGHVALQADVNGSPIRFLLDTGASYVTLTPEDARAAGLRGGDLHFTQRVATANGEVRVAPVKLREIRLGQFVMEDVDAVVVDTQLRTSLLGMSFLKRLDSYEMRDGALVITW